MSENTTDQPSDNPQLSVAGVRIRILADATTTDGEFVAFEDISPPGVGPPLHRHRREHEFFYVIEGTVKFVVDGSESIVSAGGAAFAARGSIHAFVNVSTAPSRMLIVASPAGFEIAFRQADALAREGRDTPDALAAVFAANGTEFLGPPLAVE